MPKMKTNSSAKRKIKVTASGRLRRRQAFRNHLLRKKSAAQKRRLGRERDVPKSHEKNIKKLLGM